MAYFVAYFVFDPSVKFRFKTQSFVIDGIDGILFSRKMKKNGDGREKYGVWEKIIKTLARIYAIYAIYATAHTVFRNGVAGG